MCIRDRSRPRGGAMRGDTQLLSARAVRWIDIGVIVWVVVWVALGVLIWHDIRAQMQLSAEVEASGEDSRGSIERTAVIAGLGVGILPVAMILFLYLPVRVRWRRYVGAVADALPGSAGDAAFEQYLARRAADTLPWDRLRALSADPWRAIASGDYRALADAELARLGLRRP